MDIDTLLRRAKSYAEATDRTPGGVSKALFDDNRTLDLLAAGWRGVTLARLEKAEIRLSALEAAAMRREPAQ